MYRILMLIMTFCIFVSGCCCKPYVKSGTNASYNNNIPAITDVQKEKLNKAADYITEQIKEKKANELYNKEYISKPMLNVSNMEHTYKEMIKCIESYLGDIQSYNPDKKKITKTKMNVAGTIYEVYTVMQPVKYTTKDLVLKIQLVEEDNKMKMFGIYWHTPNVFKDPPDYMKCIMQINK